MLARTSRKIDCEASCLLIIFLSRLWSDTYYKNQIMISRQIQCGICINYLKSKNSKEEMMKHTLLSGWHSHFPKVDQSQ